MATLASAPLLMSTALRNYGVFLYRTNCPKYAYADVINAVQKLFKHLRHKMPHAWDLLGAWEEMEPGERRPAMPESVYKAMVVQCLLWGWHAAAVILIICFLSLIHI